MPLPTKMAPISVAPSLVNTQFYLSSLTFSHIPDEASLSMEAAKACL